LVAEPLSSSQLIGCQLGREQDQHRSRHQPPLGLHLLHQSLLI
jgi:hypothetical protein